MHTPPRATARPSPATDPFGGTTALPSALRIAFLDSWHPAPHEGSGTAVGIAALRRGLEALGHRIEVLRPDAAPASVMERRAFDRSLPVRLEALGDLDLVVGFDVDGTTWSRVRPARSRYVVALKGIAADEARFSRTGEERTHLLELASLERENARSADRVLVPSTYSAGIVTEVYGIPEDRIAIVPEPIDLSVWEELLAERTPRPGRPTILSVARQYPRKDTATLLRALPRVREALPDLHLHLVGGGPELPTLVELAASLLPPGTVTFHGAVPEDDLVRRRYMKAHLFCLPSRQEGFGIVFLEAMAAGLPIVAARAGAVPEVVPHGEVGWLVEPEDPPALAEALLALLRDPGERRRMGDAGRRRVRDFDLTRVALAFLRAALRPGPGGPPGMRP